jgi:hypothetical protein
MKCVENLAGFTWKGYLSHPEFLQFLHDPGVWGLCFGTYGRKALVLMVLIVFTYASMYLFNNNKTIF